MNLTEVHVVYSTLKSKTLSRIYERVACLLLFSLA
jgi:hypothetical protein